MKLDLCQPKLNQNVSLEAACIKLLFDFQVLTGRPKPTLTDKLEFRKLWKNQNM